VGVRFAGVIAVLALAGAAGCGSGDPSAAEDAKAEAVPLAKRDLNLRRGTWRGVGLRSTKREVVRTLGPVKSTANGPWAPLGRDYVGQPVTPANPPGEGPVAVWRGRNFAFDSSYGRAYMFIVTARGTKTGKGVGVGDTLAEVRRAYPKLRCDIANKGTEYVQFPYCTGRVARRRYVWFGGDPVESVTIGSVRLE
jgi:hypothetical protein